MVEGRERRLGLARGKHGEGRQPIGLLRDPLLREHGCGGRDEHFLRRARKRGGKRTKGSSTDDANHVLIFPASGRGLVRRMACDHSTDRAHLESEWSLGGRGCGSTWGTELGENRGIGRA